jgi:tRNA(fMet)-specific endonuclease VapC
MSVRFMLDTDIVSYALRGQGRAADAIAQHQSNDLCVSVITMAQLCYGADRRRSSKVRDAIDEFARKIEIVPFNESCARYYGAIASDLERRGIPIGDFDVLIAAHALAIDATLVTNNVKHFSRVHGLRVENWF